MIVRVPECAEEFIKPATWKSVDGGRGSGKSYLCAQTAVLRAAGRLPWYKPEAVRIASARSFESTIEQSVKQVVEGFIRKLGLRREFDVHKHWIDHIPTGSHIFFPGVNRNPDSFLSMEAVDVFWMEQAESLQDEMEKVIPTIARNRGCEFWFSWNPRARHQWCWKRFKTERRRPDDVVISMTYEDNPWWYPRCSNIQCQTPYSWKEREGVCKICGAEKWPGLYELETERIDFQRNEPGRYAHVYDGRPDDGDASKQVLTYDMLEACIEAFQKGLAPRIEDRLPVHAGLDIAEGGEDKCCQVVRCGPVVEYLDTWPGVAGDLSVAAKRATEKPAEVGFSIMRQYYDASAPMKREFVVLKVPYRVREVHFGGKVGGPKQPYDNRRTNEQTFARRNIQMADALRLRVMNTLRLVRGENVDPMHCFFINPALPNLRRYLDMMCKPTRRENPVSFKWELDKRGGDEEAKSPDEFDATCLAFGDETDGRGLRATRGAL